MIEPGLDQARKLAKWVRFAKNVFLDSSAAQLPFPQRFCGTARKGPFGINGFVSSKFSRLVIVSRFLSRSMSTLASFRRFLVNHKPHSGSALTVFSPDRRDPIACTLARSVERRAPRREESHIIPNRPYPGKTCINRSEFLTRASADSVFRTGIATGRREDFFLCA